MAAGLDRRRLIGLGFAGTALLLASGHTPYRQWVVYRRRRLLIGTSRSDTPTYPLGLEVAEVLLTHLPESQARASRAADSWRLASLLATGQFDVAILSKADASALLEGRPPFAEFGPVALRGLFAFGGHLLVARADFPDRHAYLVSQTLAEHGRGIPSAAPASASSGAVPPHPGALAYAAGRPLPELTTVQPAKATKKPAD